MADPARPLYSDDAQVSPRPVAGNPLWIRQWAAAQSAPVGQDVLAYLETHLFLIPVLTEAQRAVMTHFPGAPMSYRVSSDPEDGPLTKLVLSIAPQTPPSDALRQYRRFQQDWWIPALPQAQGALTVVMEYL